MKHVIIHLKHLLLLLLIWGFGMASPASGKSSSTEVSSKAEIRALWLVNLARFVDWPEISTNPLVISVIGDQEMVNHLHPYRRKKVKGREIKVQSFDRFKYQEELKSSSIIFIASGAHKKCADILLFTNGECVFTISDAPSFVEMGGMMSLDLSRNSISYALNRDAATAEQITISSDLLGRASRVIGSSKGRTL